MARVDGKPRTRIGEKTIVDLSARSLIRGSVLQALAFVIVSVLLPLAVAPIVLNAIGPATYGIWAVLLNLGGWIYYLDLGISLGIPKLTAELAVGEERLKLNRLMSSTLALWAVGTLILIFGAWTTAPSVFRFLFPQNSTDLDRILLIVITAHFASLLAGRIVSQGLAGMQKLESAARISLTTALFQNAAIVIAMKNGYGLVMLAAIHLAASTTQFVALLIVWKKEAGQSGLFAFDPGLLKRAAGAGIILYGVQALTQIFQLDRIYFAAARIPLEQIAEYHLGASLAAKAAGLIGALTAVIYPAASSFSAMQDRRRLEELAIRGTKFLMIAASFMFGYLCLFAPEFVRLWLGRPSEGTTTAARIMCLWGFTSVTGGLTAIGAGLGRPGYQLKSSILALIIAAPLFFVLGRPMGTAGIAWTISLSVAAVAIIYVFDFTRIILPGCGGSLRKESLVKPVIATAGLIPAYGSVVFLKHQTLLEDSRTGCALLLFVALVISLGIFISVAKSVRLFDEKDREQLFKII